MIEQWKDIKDFEGIYQVSNLGRIKSLERIVIDKKGNKKICRETIKTIHDNGKGYMNVNLWKDNKSYMRYVHRLVAQAFIPNLEDKSTVNHKDFNRSNNCVDNLEWATYKEQEKHKYANGHGGDKGLAAQKARERMLSNQNPSKLNPKYGKDSSNHRDVICEKKIFDTIKDCAEYYGVNYGTMRGYFCNYMPKKWVDLGLMYYDEYLEKTA
ncbi:MAG: NUMOD4 motif-containing HNH endonuclease [Clostridia bacterium]|nr:NUMOD4 motif-containing HNH endonuclease [Clostridia bacterium]MCI2014559.1 NUMOD4 motif-containing HNH endonuclease [Clostridia bacterium]